MPITESARKSLRVSLRRRNENLRLAKLLKEALRKSSKERLPEVFSAVDKAAKFGLIHQNKAARIKGNLSKKFGVTSKAAKATKKSSKKSAKK